VRRIHKLKVSPSSGVLIDIFKNVGVLHIIEYLDCTHKHDVIFTVC